ncbi:alpha/beta hydrolase family protein [Candidatus Lokiarchaeum ossiferum]|uniref:alpha/beta hydrolase family protein n=1 Tax=Candidatus Lokiarchaeum ossiferum TaxID=2951803 RepID=UPI00352FEA34
MNYKTNKEKIKDYLSIESCAGASWSPKDDFVSMIYNQPGQFQVFDLKIHENAQNWPKQRTFEDDRCTDPHYLKDGTIVFLRDFKGHENFQIGLIDNTKQIHWISSDEKAKHFFTYISKEYLYFSANIENKKCFSLYRQKLPILKNPMEKIFTPPRNSGFYSTRLESPNKKSVIITNNISIVHHNLIWLNLEDHSQVYLSELAAPNQIAVWKPIRFIDDHHLLILTDYKADYAQLMILSITGELFEIKDINKLPPYEIHDWTWNSSSPYTYFVVNEEGYSKLYRGKFSSSGTNSIESILLPVEGVIIGGDQRTSTKNLELSHNGKYLSAVISSSDFPTNLWILNTTKLNWWCATDMNLQGLNQKEFRKASLFHFESSDNISIPYFRYLPSGKRPEKGYPTIFIIHGGPEGQSKPNFSGLHQYFLAAHFALIIPNIRGSSGYGTKYVNLDNIEKRLDSTRDIAELANHLSINDNEIDGNRLGIFGGSYGGFAVLSAITEYPELWKAAVELFGISNFVTFLENTAPWRRKLREVEYGYLDRDLEILNQISPIHKIDKIQCPLLLEGGDTDERVPISETIQMYEAIKTKVPSKLIRFEDEGHGITKLKNKLILHPQIVNWFKNYL